MDPLKVFITTRDSECGECGESLERGEWITLERDRGALCLPCAELDHLLFLPSGNAALTRRATKHSSLTAIVLKWSRARKRYERKGILAAEDAIEAAERECLADEEVRRRRREREAVRRAELDADYVRSFAARVREMFPNCPAKVENRIAEHACRKYSGRVGRSAAAKSLDEKAVRLAVVAHVRHTKTSYDGLLAQGRDRHEARSAVENKLWSVLAEWE